MNFRSIVSSVIGLGVAAAVMAPAPANANDEPGPRDLASVLTSDGNQFDHNWYDYDVVTEAVLAVLANKPNSPVGVLADGSTPLTAFLPNDRAFQVLVKDLTGRWVRSEAGVFNAVAGLGIDTVETVLLYHVVPGATITSRQAARSNGATLTTAQGGTVKVRVYNRRLPLVRLKDQDRNDVDPFLNPWRLDINKGNQQIAHGITFVLRPADL